VNRNLSSSKAYNHEYRRAKALIKLPAAFVASQYESKLMLHFYSGDERRRLFLGWTGVDEKSAGCEAFNQKSCDGASGGENRVEPLPKPGVRVEV